jgi:hypothetical protein
LTVLSCGACDTQSELEEPDASDYAEDTAAAMPPTVSDKVPTAEIADGIFYMFEGEMRRLNYTVHTPEGAEGEVEWASSSDSVIVENGIVYAKKEGYAIVSGGGERNCVVRVLPKTLPILNINTNGVAITSKENYVDCRVDLSTSNADYCFEGARGGIRIRGNSTSNRPKKPYRIKFDSKRNLLGMNEDAECKSWVLLAEWYDASMLHNSASLSLASVILTEYTSDWRNVNVYINGEYQGVYLLAEQSQINENRVDIEEAGKDSSSIHSGYLFEQEAGSNNPDFLLEFSGYSFKNFLGKKFTAATHKYELKNDNLTAEQKEFAAKYMKNLFKVLYTATYEGYYLALDENANIVKSGYKTAEETVSALIDVDSFVRKYIHSELTCNWDDRSRSYFTYVDFSEGGTGLLTFACPWDFDHAFYKYGTFEYAPVEEYFAASRNMWYVMLLNHEFIRARIAEVWQEVYVDTNGFDSSLDMMLLITRNYESELRTDADMWNRGRDRITQVATTYQWLIRRIEWMNGQFSNPKFVTDGKV